MLSVLLIFYSTKVSIVFFLFYILFHSNIFNAVLFYINRTRMPKVKFNRI